MDYQNKRRLLGGISLFLLLIFYLFKNLSEGMKLFAFISEIFVFYLIDHMFKINFKLKHYFFVIIIFGFGTLLSPLYVTYSLYDKVLHFILPILGSMLFFYIIDKKNLTLQWKLFITFLFVTSFIGLHEIGEYLMDIFFDMTLQGVQIKDMANLGKLNTVMSKIDDTMIDMILGVIGSLFFVCAKTVEHYWKKRK